LPGHEAFQRALPAQDFSDRQSIHQRRSLRKNSRSLSLQLAIITCCVKTEKGALVSNQAADQRIGWESIWNSGQIPKRFASFSTPNGTVVEWADTLTPGAVVLDIGCGVGRHCVYLGERGFRVAGMDISPSGIKQSQDACTARNIPFDGRVSDMSALPWPNATFDAALSTATIHHQLRANLVRTMAEVVRILKPGGAFQVDFPCTETLDYQLLRGLVAAGQIAEVEPNTFVDQRPITEDIDGYLPHHYCDEADIRDLLSSFEIVKLWAALHESTRPDRIGMVGKWVAWARKPN
jgi:SAM-dependent methyltransferase